MRILHVLTAFPRDENDVIVPWLVELLVRLKERGHQVEVLTSAYRGGGNRSYAGIPVHRFRYFPARWEDLTHDEAVPERLKRSLRYRFAVLSYVLCGIFAGWRTGRRGRYDVVHVHWAVPHVLFGRAAAAASDAAMVTTFYGAELRWARSRIPGMRWLLKMAARRSARMVAISNHTAAEVEKLTGMRPEVIPYGIGLSAAERSPWPPRSVEEKGDQGFTVLFVGRLVERKGVHVLLRAAAKVRGQYRLRVVVVGDGPERGRLENLARELGLEQSVEFRGRVTDEELARSYRAADAFVLPAVVDSRGETEGLGVVLLEAMSYGVPVVASRAGGITDIVEDGANGLLVDAGDAEALAGALARLMEDRALASRLGEAGRRTVEARFRWERITDRWERLYSEAVA